MKILLALLGLAMMVDAQAQFRLPSIDINKMVDTVKNVGKAVKDIDEPEEISIGRDVASRLTKFAMQAAMGIENARMVSALRAFRAELRGAFDAYDSPYVSIDVLLSWATRRFAAVTVEFAPRAGGRSGYTFRALVRRIERLPLAPMRYQQYTARRRVVSYGGQYDFSAQRLQAAEPLPDWLQPLCSRAAAWAGLADDPFTQALVAEYQPGTPLGWHRDVPDFEEIAGVSLAGRCRMRLRPYPPQKNRRDLTIALDLEPRSAYAIVGPARWKWQHAISPTKELRYSITFRTLR